MHQDHKEKMTMAGGKSSSELIYNILSTNVNVSCGIIGVDDNLNVIFRQCFHERLKFVDLIASIGAAKKSASSAIIAFDIFDSDIFISDSALIKRLKGACELFEIELIDLMLFGHNDWVSLRRENRI